MIYYIPNDSYLKVQDVFDVLPDFMLHADTLFIDPPFNQQLYTNYNSRKNIQISKNNTLRYVDFINCLFLQINNIHPKFLFLEIGKEYLADYIYKCKQVFKYVTFYNSKYHYSDKNKCYIIQATDLYKNRRYSELEDLDEKDIIKWICKNHEYNCIGDLCMGKGLVGKHAYLNNKKFVGIELNESRLMKLVNYIKRREENKYVK